MQYLIRRKDYGFLKYDSFVSATEIQRIHCERLALSIKEGETAIIGHLEAEHLNELLVAARASRLFSKKEKQAFLY